MEKRTVFVMFMMVSVVFCLAQSIDSLSYKNAADYVIGYYVKSYIEKKTDIRWIESNFKNSWDKIENNSMENPINEIELEALISHLPKELNDEDLMKKTLDFHNSIKTKRLYKTGTVDQLIELPEKYFQKWSSNGENKPKFQKQYDSLKRYLSDYFTKKNKLVLQSDKSIGDNPAAVELEILPDFKSVSAKNRKNQLVFLLVLIVLIILFIILYRNWFFSILRKLHPKLPSNHTKQNKQYVDWETKYNELLVKHNDMLNYQELLRGEVEFKDEQLRRTILMVNELRKNINISNSLQGSEFDIKSSCETIMQSNSVKNLYADAIHEGFFNKVKENPDVDTIYELKLQDLMDTKFTVFHKAIPMIMKRPEFLDGSDKQVLSNARVVEVIEEGVAQLQVNGKWKICKKLNVILK